MHISNHYTSVLWFRKGEWPAGDKMMRNGAHTQAMVYTIWETIVISCSVTLIHMVISVKSPDGDRGASQSSGALMAPPSPSLTKRFRPLKYNNHEIEQALRFIHVQLNTIYRCNLLCQNPHLCGNCSAITDDRNPPSKQRSTNLPSRW